MPFINRNLDQNIPQMLKIMQGEVDGLSHVQKFGDNPVVSTTAEDIWEIGGVKTYANVTGATTTSVVSGSVNDQAGTTGAVTITVYGLDTNWDQVHESIALTGTTPATLTTQFVRVFRIKVRGAGSSGYNEGTITASIGSNVETAISPTYNQTTDTHFAVPRNHAAVMFNFSGYIESNKIGTYIVQVRPFGEVFHSKCHVEASNPFNVPLNIVIPEKSDVRVQGYVSAATGHMSAICDYYLLNYGATYYSTAWAKLANHGDASVTTI